MRIFVTGATGFIGSAIVPELINAGHQVLGLARSEAGAQALLAAGAEVHRGDLDDLDSLRRGAAISDGVIHTAFKHDFSKLAANCEADRHVVEAIGSVLAGSARPLVITSVTGLGVAAPGQAASEDNFDPQQRNPRIAAELASAALVQRGVNVSVVRLSQVHSPVKQGFVTLLVQLAREKGVSAYVGDGLNRWPAVHLSDAARLYRLALEKQQTGSRYHAVAEEGTPLRTIAEAIGQSLKLPVTSLSPPEAAAHFGWLSDFVSRDLSASSAKTREWLGWEPSGPRLIEDLAQVR